MVLTSRSSLVVLINRLTSIPFSGDEEAMQARLEILDAAVEADTLVLFRMPVGEGVVRVLAEKGLTVPVERFSEGIVSPRIAGLISNCRDTQVVSAKGPFTGDPFLVDAGAKWLLMACAKAGPEYVATIALRHREKAFVKREWDRFSAVAQVLNLQMYCLLADEEAARLRINDPVTGLGRFPVFHQTLGKELSRARRRSGKVSVGILALSAGGYTVPEEGVPGNETILFVAEVLKSQMRNFDTIVRYSPHEFALILPDIGGPEVLKVMDRVLGVIKSEAGEVCPQVHIGLSCYPEDASTVERLIETAEAAVNLAREKGQSAVSRWKEE